MTPVTCKYCGLPFKVRRVETGRDYFCCTGCAMLSRVPVDDKGQFPVNGHLVSALIAAFLYFNELLFWLVGTLLVREGRMENALRFFWLAGGAAFAVWLTLALMQWRERAARTFDVVMMTMGLGVLLAALRRLPPVPMEMAAANFLLILWTFRGLLRRGLRKGKA